MSSAPSVPSQATVLAAWGQRLQGGRVFAKTAKMHAKCAAAAGVLETIIKGQKETSKAYRPGDYILQGAEGEQYCIDGHVFHQRYARAFEPAQTKLLQDEGFRLYSATGRVWAHQLGEQECAASFPAGQFIAAWGEPMAVAPGDWLVAPRPAANEVYRVEVSAFAKTRRQHGHAPTMAKRLWQGSTCAGSCASSERTEWLWAARHALEERPGH